MKHQGKKIIKKLVKETMLLVAGFAFVGISQAATDGSSLEPVQLWENGPYWAQTNIGASQPEESGYYFWWGDTVGYKWVNESWCAADGSKSNFEFLERNCSTYRKDFGTLLSKGYITSEGQLTAKYDAAKQHWGEAWRMPTKADFRELADNCTVVWTTRNGVVGKLVTGKGAFAEKSIFLPAAGGGCGSFRYGSTTEGRYWSSTIQSYFSLYAYYLEFGTFYLGPDNVCYSRCLGRTIRPVTDRR